MDESLLESFGDPIGEGDFDALEAAAGFELPKAFRRFFGDHGGCFVNGNTSVVFEGGPSDLLQFHGVSRPYDPFTRDTTSLRVGLLELGYPSRSIVFADDLGGNAYYLAPMETGISVFWLGDLREGNGTRVADSFEEFLDLVEVSPFEDG